MKRRAFLIGGAASAMLATSRALGQSKVYRMAFLSAQSPRAISHLEEDLFGALRRLGYMEGHNLQVERRYAEGRLEQLPALAAELVALNPDILFAGASQAALAAVKATTTIPIVFVAVSDPVGMGLVKSLARPGTNATGLSAQNIDVHSKRLQLLKEAFPSASRVAVLHNPLNAVERQMLSVLKDASAALKIELRVVAISSEGDFPSVFKSLDAERPQVLYVLESPFTFLHRTRIVDFVNSRQLPTIYGLHDFVLAGGLLSYSFPLLEHYRGAADFIAKILKGAKPAELPVEQPTRFELSINTKTARAQGIVFPPAVLVRADRVIE